MLFLNPYLFQKAYETYMDLNVEFSEWSVVKIFRLSNPHPSVYQVLQC